MAAPGFWNNPEAARKVVEEVKSLKALIGPFEALKGESEDLEALEGLLAESGQEHPEEAAELESGARRFIKGVRGLELRAMLGGPNDDRNGFFSLHAGAGGTDACDWVAMLARMYQRYFDRVRYKYQVLEVTEGDEAGLRRILMEVTGDRVYGMLKSEIGVHREPSRHAVLRGQGLVVGVHPGPGFGGLEERKRERADSRSRRELDRLAPAAGDP